MSAELSSNDDGNEVFRELEAYPWSTDKEFQGGLAAILGPNPSSDPSQIHDLTLRAQCFYYSRKKSIPIDFSSYKAYLSTRPSRPTPTSTPIPTSTSLSSNPPTPPPHTTSPPPKMAVQLPQTSPPQPSQSPPHPAAFQQIIAMIQSGAPIPGIMTIPDTVLTGQSSTPVLPKRKKPWEKELPSTTEGTFGDLRDEYIAQELPDEMGALSSEGEAVDKA